MAKQHGLGMRLFVGGYNLSGDVGAINSIRGGPTALDMTGIDASAHEREGGVRDGGIDYTSFFNDASGHSHPVLKTLPTTDQIVTACVGTTLGFPAVACVGKQIGYDGTRNADGSLLFAVQTAGTKYGVEWGKQLTAGIRTDTGATTGASVDFGSTPAVGLFAQAYLHVFSFTGTDVTIKIQTSEDDAVGDPFADRISFTQVTAGPTAERAVHSNAGQSVERYARVITTTSGGFSNLQFAVMLNQNLTVVSF